MAKPLEVLTLLFDEFVQQISQLKQDIPKILSRKDIPLEDRWNFFVKYGEYLGDKKTWIQHFDIEKKLKSGEIIWYDTFYTERYATIKMTHIVERIQGELDYLHEKGSSTDNLIKAGWTQEILDEFKEEILTKNLYSFEYDW